MKDLLSAAGREVLAQFAWSHVLVGFDFDGTLAPIVARPDDAELPARSRALLAEVAARYPTIVVSGRARQDVTTRLGGVPLREVVGNHGLEPSRSVERLTQLVRRWMPVLHGRLDAIPGVAIEDKGCSVAIHYRRSRAKKLARDGIEDAIRLLPDGVRVIGGKQVVNVLPPGAPHKGTAVEAARLAARADTVIYVGDDETDEDVFGFEARGRLLSVRVGRSTRSQASYFLASQARVATMLDLLVELRPGAESRRRETLAR